LTTTRSISFEMYDKLEIGLYEQQVSGSNVVWHKV